MVKIKKKDLSQLETEDFRRVKTSEVVDGLPTSSGDNDGVSSWGGTDKESSGLAAFLLVSADALQEWWVSVIEMLEREELEDVSQDVRSRVSGFLKSKSKEELVELSGRDWEGLEDNSLGDGSSGGMTCAILSSMWGLDHVLLPAPVKLVLGMGSTLWKVLQGVMWGLVVFGGFSVVRRKGSRTMTSPNGDASFSLEWDYEVERTRPTTTVGYRPAGRGISTLAGEQEGSEVLFERLTGQKAVGGALSSGYYRSNGDVHGAWDLRTPDGTELHWPFEAEGTVVRVNESPTGGKQLFVRTATHEWGFAHLSSNTVVPVGTVLCRGDVFAVSGHSGRAKNGAAYSPHLHVSATRVEDVGKSYSSDRERRLLHANLVDAVQGEGVEVSVSGDSDHVGDVPTTIGSIDASPTVYGSPVAERTNNPYSVSALSGDAWEGQVGSEVLPDGQRIAKFDTVQSAARAAALTLLRYQYAHDLSRTGGVSIRLEDIGRYYVDGNKSGGLSSNARRWVRGMEDDLGVGRGGSVDLRDVEQLNAVLTGVARHESSSAVSNREQRGGVAAAYSYLEDRGYNNQGGQSVAPNVQR